MDISLTPQPTQAPLTDSEKYALMTTPKKGDLLTGPVEGFVGHHLRTLSIAMGGFGACHGLANRYSPAYRNLTRGRIPQATPLLCVAGATQLVAVALMNSAAAARGHSPKYAVSFDTTKKHIVMWPFGMQMQGLERSNRHFGSPRERPIATSKIFTCRDLDNLPAPADTVQSTGLLDKE